MKNTVETFQDPRGYAFQHLRGSREPYCFNRTVGVRRFRVIAEIIDEPQEVIEARLEKLWVESDNFHDMDPLKDEAKKIGYEFKGDWGSKRPKRNGE